MADDINRVGKRKNDDSEDFSGPASKRASVTEEVAAYDSDEEPPPVQGLVRSWRLDPEESLSDWTIELVVNNETHSTYHVHKANLAVGPRRSEYFVKLFSQGGRFAESKDTTSRIEMVELAAESFPTLLDYMYSEVAAIPLNSSNASALYSMGKYFDVRRLRRESKQFWQKDIKSSRTCGTYYAHARTLEDDTILHAATQACLQNIMKITETSHLVNIPVPLFWLEMLKNKPKEVTSNQFSCHMSILIAKFIQCNPDLGSDMLEKLTDPELLPHIHNGAALLFIDLERTIVTPDKSCLSSLQRRCIASLVESWVHMDLQAQGSVMMELAKKQSPLVLAEILAGTLSAAKEDKTKLENELQSSKTQVQTKTKEVQAMTREVQTKTREVQVKSTELAQTRRQVRLKTAELSKQTQEMSNFYRLDTKNTNHVMGGSVKRSSLPERHTGSTSGQNVYLNTPLFQQFQDTPTGVPYPLFYYKKP